MYLTYSWPFQSEKKYLDEIMIMYLFYRNSCQNIINFKKSSDLTLFSSLSESTRRNISIWIVREMSYSKINNKHTHLMKWWTWQDFGLSRKNFPRDDLNNVKLLQFSFYYSRNTQWLLDITRTLHLISENDEIVREEKQENKEKWISTNQCEYSSLGDEIWHLIVLKINGNVLHLHHWKYAWNDSVWNWL